MVTPIHEQLLISATVWDIRFLVLLLMDLILVLSDGMHEPATALVGVSHFRKVMTSVHEQLFISSTVCCISFLVLLNTRCSRLCGSTVSARSWLLNDDDAFHTEPRGR